MDGTLVDTFNLIRDSYNYAVGARINALPGTNRASGAQGYTLEEALAKWVPVSDIPSALVRFHDYFEKKHQLRRESVPRRSRITDGVS